MIIAPCVGDYSFRQLLNIVKKLDMDQIVKISGNAESKPYKKRSEFELTSKR